MMALVFNGSALPALGPTIDTALARSARPTAALKTVISRDEFRQYPSTVDSKKLEYGPGTIYGGVPFFSRFWAWGTVIFQLSGFYMIFVRKGACAGKHSNDSFGISLVTSSGPSGLLNLVWNSV